MGFDIHGKEINNPRVFTDFPGRLRFQAHRGLSTDYPENTLVAMAAARRAGYDSVEIDPRITSDGVVVLCHDTTIDRTSNGSGTISAMTYAQVAQYDFGGWFSAEFAGTKIPTAEETLMLCKQINLLPRWDSYFKLFTAEQRQALYALIRKTGMGRFTGFNCGTDLTIAAEIMDALPDAELHFDYIDPASLADFTEKGDDIVVWIKVGASDAAAKAGAIHAAGFRVGFWTIDNQDTATNVIDGCYADIIESNGGIDPLHCIREIMDSIS